jgi:hypothetical protein
MSTPKVTHHTEVDGEAEFNADLAYLKGLSEAIFEHASPQALLHIAAFDRDRA